MLTLLVTILATAYFVVPALLTRFVVSFYFVRKANTGTRSEEILRSSFWAVVPLLIAWWSRNRGWWTVPPHAAPDAQTVFSGLYSERAFAANMPAFFAGCRGFAAFNLCLLLRTYFIVFLGALLFGGIARNLGWVRERLKGWPRLKDFLFWVFMPRISEWYVALSPILVHDRKGLTVRIDVLTKGGILYRGNVFEKRIAADGTLATSSYKALNEWFATTTVVTEPRTRKRRPPIRMQSNQLRTTTGGRFQARCSF